MSQQPSPKAIEFKKNVEEILKQFNHTKTEVSDHIKKINICRALLKKIHVSQYYQCGELDKISMPARAVICDYLKELNAQNVD